MDEQCPTLMSPKVDLIIVKLKVHLVTSVIQEHNITPRQDKMILHNHDDMIEVNEVLFTPIQ